MSQAYRILREPAQDLYGRATEALALEVLASRGLLPSDLERLRERDRLLIVRREEPEEKWRTRATDFPYSFLMLNRDLILMLQFAVGAAALKTLIAQMTSGSPKERREARERLGIDPKPSAKRSKEQEDDADDDAKESPVVATLKPESEFSVMPVVASTLMLAQRGWLTLSTYAVMFAHATTRAGRFGLKALGAVAQPHNQIRMAAPAPIFAVEQASI